MFVIIIAETNNRDDVDIILEFLEILDFIGMEFIIVHKKEHKMDIMVLFVLFPNSEICSLFFSFLDESLFESGKDIFEDFIGPVFVGMVVAHGIDEFDLEFQILDQFFGDGNLNIIFDQSFSEREFVVNESLDKTRFTALFRANHQNP